MLNTLLRDLSNLAIEELERLKIANEIADRTRARRIGPHHHAAALYPSLVQGAFFTLVAAISWWSSSSFKQIAHERGSLEASRSRFELDVSRFQEDKSSLQRENESLRKANAELQLQADAVAIVENAMRSLAGFKGVAIQAFPGGGIEIVLSPSSPILASQRGKGFHSSVWRERDEILDCLVKLPDVRRLTLNGISLDDIALRKLASVKLTGELVCYDNMLTDDLVAQLPSYSDVTRLHLIQQPFSDPSRLRVFNKLKYLNLSNTNTGDEGLRKLEPLLRIVDSVLLSRTAVTDDSAELISLMPQIRQVGVDGSQITSSGFDAIMRLPYLRSVSVGSNMVSNERLEELRKMNPYCTVIVENNGLQALYDFGEMDFRAPSPAEEFDALLRRDVIKTENGRLGDGAFRVEPPLNGEVSGD